MKTHLPATILCLLLPLTVLTQAPVPEACEFTYGTFTEATPMPFPLAGMASGVIDGKIYLASGYDMGPGAEIIYPDHLSVFDPESNTWDTTGAAIPMDRDMYMANNTALDGKLYVIGGLNFIWADNAWLGIPFARVDVYDPQSGTWELKANVPVPLGGNGVCTMDGKLYVTGGLTTDNTQLNSFYSYDPGTDSWESLTEMPIPRVFHVSVALDGRIYVISGNSGGGIDKVTTNCMVYDRASDKWDDIAPLPKAVTFAAACVLDGEIYVFGGDGSSGFSADVYKYNPETDAWVSLERMIPNRRDIVAVPIGGTIYLMGGRISGTVVSNSVQAFELSKVKLDAPISVDSVGADPVHVDLSDHFSHKDGGSITYSVCQDGSDILDAAVNGSMLTLTGLADGDTEVHILAQSGEDRMGDVFQVHVNHYVNAIRDICEDAPLLQVYPNPSHGLTTLAYSVRSPGWVRLEIFDLLGKRVAIPVGEYRTPGEFEYQFDTGELIPGIYLCNLTTAGERSVVKLVVEH